MDGQNNNSNQSGQAKAPVENIPNNNPVNNPANSNTNYYKENNATYDNNAETPQPNNQNRFIKNQDFDEKKDENDKHQRPKSELQKDEDNEIENLDDGDLSQEEYPEQMSEDGLENPEQVNPEAQKKFGEKEYKNTAKDKDYYKKEQKENEEKYKNAQKEREAAKKEKQEFNNQKRSSKQNNNSYANQRNNRNPNQSNDVRENKAREKEIKERNKKAKKDESAAKKTLQNSKIANAKSKAYAVRHPIEAAKEKAKERLKKKAIKTIMTNPKSLLAIGGGVLVIAAIFLIIVLLGGVFGGIVDVETTDLGGSSTICTYSTFSNPITQNTKVEIYSCDATSTSPVLKTLSLEEYIVGVSLAEMGYVTSPEALKAEMIAVRTYVLSKTKATVTNPNDLVPYDSAADVIRMRNCESDKVYWNYTEDLYRKVNHYGSGVSQYSPDYIPNENDVPYRAKLNANQINVVRTIGNSVAGQYLSGVDGGLITPTFDPTDASNFIKLETDNKGTADGEFPSILLKMYPDAKNISVGKCTVVHFGAGGEYSNWKQKTNLGATWGNVTLGNNSGTTINNIGCYVVSLAIVIAERGVATNLSNFNPGTFAQALKNAQAFSKSGALDYPARIKNVVPSYSGINVITLSGDKNSTINTVKSHALQNESLIIKVRTTSSQHFVAVDKAASAASGWSTIYIFDPAGSNTDLFSRYSNVVELRVVNM